MPSSDLLSHRTFTPGSFARTDRELASWVIVATILGGHRTLGVVETHPGHPGEYDCLSVYDRARTDRPPLLDLDRLGSAYLAPVGGGASQWAEVWEACEQDGPVAVAQEICDRVGLPEPSPHDGIEASTINQLARRMLKLHEANIAGAWECRNGVADSSEGARRRIELFEQVPAGLERLASAPESVLGDPAHGFWFLLRDGVPVSCLDVF